MQPVSLLKSYQSLCYASRFVNRALLALYILYWKSRIIHRSSDWAIAGLSAHFLNAVVPPRSNHFPVTMTTCYAFTHITWHGIYIAAFTENDCARSTETIRYRYCFLFGNCQMPKHTTKDSLFFSVFRRDRISAERLLTSPCPYVRMQIIR
jgi:hypothetical protein